MNEQNICTTILFSLLLMLVACKSHKSVTEQVFTKTDSVSTLRTDSVSMKRAITIKDSTEVRDSVATSYIIGIVDSMARLRVDTVKQYRYHYERKATERDESDSGQQKQSQTTTIVTASTTQSASTVENKASVIFFYAVIGPILAIVAVIILTIHLKK